MAKTRTSLSAILHTICPNVYFQPPPTIKLTYPCIVYNLEKPMVERADNIRYKVTNCYSIKYITTDPDTTVGETIANSFDCCEINRYYVSDNLTHVSLTLYY